MDELVQSIFNGLLEEMIWKVAVLEHKRSKGFRLFSAEQEQYAIDKKSGNDKHHPDTVHDCPICGREVSATRFAPHLSKCLGIGGRGLAAKKLVRSELGEAESSTKGASLPPSDPPLSAGKKQAASAKRRGRPPKKPPTVLSPAEHEALLSNAINNATQRLHLQGLGLPIPPSLKPLPPVPHPLSQSHLATPPAPKIKRKKKKEEPTRHRSRNSSQASSSSDSEEEEDEEDDEEEDDENDDGGEEGGADPGSCTPAGRVEEDEDGGEADEASDNEATSPVSIAAPAPVVLEKLQRPPLKRRSSSQADSTDGDSD